MALEKAFARADEASDWTGSSAPFLLVVHTVANRVRIICRAVSWQAVLLKPGIGYDGSGRLIFISPDVHRAADNTRIAVEVNVRDDIGVVPGIDAG